MSTDLHQLFHAAGELPPSETFLAGVEHRRCSIVRRRRVAMAVVPAGGAAVAVTASVLLAPGS
ncbi:hypothetical protein, partial [uncultured Amnibacterium sp.]|uniref:hypothetical protein n=1 Tax=uncultured Amnibacterium sp. TaxID=1631851 RepID=UPI0035CB7696